MIWTSCERYSLASWAFVILIVLNMVENRFLTGPCLNATMLIYFYFMHVHFVAKRTGKHSFSNLSTLRFLLGLLLTLLLYFFRFGRFSECSHYVIEYQSIFMDFNVIKVFQIKICNFKITKKINCSYRLFRAKNLISNKDT